MLLPKLIWGLLSHSAVLGHNDKSIPFKKGTLCIGKIVYKQYFPSVFATRGEIYHVY